ncbi:MAG: hypothetical protein K8S99_18480 [Planctomycetes bacterium]|nr:hypothetical protein [Planctomycetota bacterium]
MPALPDPAAAAQADAERINSNRAYWLGMPVDRIIADSPFLDRAVLLAGTTAFHKERMAKVPSLTKYPEAKPWIEYALTHDRELRRRGNLDDTEIAIVQSLTKYICFRGYKQAARLATADEKCRVAWFPETDRGPLHIKNVDDPITHWKHHPAPTSFGNPDNLSSDGVGSGLHIDDEPEELFPLPALRMAVHHTNDVPAVTEFLTRYSPFWGGGNYVFHDAKKRSVAIEKCSHNFIEVFQPDEHGRSYVSGMTCRDANSPQGKYQDAKRRQFLDLFGLGTEGPDSAFWAACRKFEAKLSAAVHGFPRVPRFDDVCKLFTGLWPEGLNKAGLKVHPRSGLVGYTLMTFASLADERTIYRWQRSEDGKSFPAEPEVYRF